MSDMTEIRVSLYDKTIEWDTMEDDKKNRQGLNDAIKGLNRTKQVSMTHQCAVFVSRHDIGVTEGTEDLADIITRVILMYDLEEMFITKVLNEIVSLTIDGWDDYEMPGFNVIVCYE